MWSIELQPCGIILRVCDPIGKCSFKSTRRWRSTVLPPTSCQQALARPRCTPRLWCGSGIEPATAPVKRLAVLSPRQGSVEAPPIRERIRRSRSCSSHWSNPSGVDVSLRTSGRPQWCGRTYPGNSCFLPLVFHVGVRRTINRIKSHSNSLVYLCRHSPPVGASRALDDIAVCQGESDWFQERR